jgi:hypothetical protein
MINLLSMISAVVTGAVVAILYLHNYATDGGVWRWLGARVEEVRAQIGRWRKR